MQFVIAFIVAILKFLFPTISPPVAGDKFKFVAPVVARVSAPCPVIVLALMMLSFVKSSVLFTITLSPAPAVILISLALLVSEIASGEVKFTPANPVRLTAFAVLVIFVASAELKVNDEFADEMLVASSLVKVISPAVLVIITLPAVEPNDTSPAVEPNATLLTPTSVIWSALFKIISPTAVVIFIFALVETSEASLIAPIVSSSFASTRILPPVVG